MVSEKEINGTYCSVLGENPAVNPLSHDGMLAAMDLFFITQLSVRRSFLTESSMCFLVTAACHSSGS